MINVYTYDGSFEGFLTCIYESYYRKDSPDEIISRFEYEPTLISNQVIIKTDIIKADKVVNAITEKISLDALQNIFYVFLSNVPSSDTILYAYIKLGFKLGGKIDMHLHNDVVLNVHKIKRKVIIETHNMLGFIRFKEVAHNFFYSSIEPDHNILSLISPHFAERLSSERWIIHDLSREIAALYKDDKWIIISFKKDVATALLNNKDGLYYETLWQEFFRTIAIEERKNPRLQARLMPKRYWKHLTEFN